ncbi:MAG: peptide chain release factor-like protein [Deltaproteobacteria bacterium]|nr:peptide chain release factor-like protein [Candidatus Zymogenaceae bacterium]
MLSDKDIDIEYYRASGPGGQRRNKKDTAVRAVHRPTGIVAVAAESRYRSRNLKNALDRLSQKVQEHTRIPTPRKSTRPPAYMDRRRLREKRMMSEKKRMRKKADTAGE